MGLPPALDAALPRGRRGVEAHGAPSRALRLALAALLLLAPLASGSAAQRQVVLSSPIFIWGEGYVPESAPIERAPDGSYRLTANAIFWSSYGIIINGSDVVLDGGGHFLLGPGSTIGLGIGILIAGATNVTVRDLEVSSFETGIALVSAELSTIEGAEISDAKVGLVITNSSFNAVVGNSFSGCSVLIYSGSSNYFANNTANGLPIVVIDGAEGAELSGLSVGELVVVNSRRITISGLDVAPGGSVGVEVYGSSDVSISYALVRGQYYGLFVKDSSNVAVARSAFVGNRYGAVVLSSSNVSVTSSDIYGNVEYGLYSDSPVVAVDDYWGSPAGPSVGNSTGGDRIAGPVRYEPFSISPRLALRTTTPWTPSRVTFTRSWRPPAGRPEVVALLAAGCALLILELISQLRAGGRRGARWMAASLAQPA
ncbi:MAG: right-handed parallel beta-helix repeat-containing protein [Desulfurococcaceae archaeon]